MDFLTSTVSFHTWPSSDSPVRNTRTHVMALMKSWLSSCLTNALVLGWEPQLNWNEPSPSLWEALSALNHHLTVKLEAEINRFNFCYV